MTHTDLLYRTYYIVASYQALLDKYVRKGEEEASFLNITPESKRNYVLLKIAL